jgi:iron complex outermembrane receptor protein
MSLARRPAEIGSGFRRPAQKSKSISREGALIMSRNLKVGGSLIALIVATSSYATTASAQSAAAAAAAAPAQLEEVVVTGSSIRGVAPVGSNLVSVGQEAITKTAATSVTELVNTVPAITTAGSTPQGQSAYSYYAPQIHSLAGSGSNTTLALIDGLRMPGGGLQYAQTDPNIVPTSALQRVEVLADGASSIYGSDAVAGVVNFITRKTFNGLQVNGRAGSADHYKSYDLNAIWGKTWDTGGFYIAGQYLKQDQLANKLRPFLSQGDYRNMGGSNTNQFTCSPATIRTPASGSNVYLSSGATTTIPGTAANGPCNTSIYGTAIPGVEREGVMAVFTNDFSDKLSVTGKFIYNRLQTFASAAPGLLNNITVYGPGSGKGGQINPFFVAPAGEPGATQETVSWLGLNSANDYGTDNYENNTVYLTGVADYKLTNDWSMTFSNAMAWSNSVQRQRNVFCSTCAVLDLNGTSQSNGSTTTSAVPGQNIVALNLPLTTANALDVWNGLGSNRTSAAVLKQLYVNNTQTQHLNIFYQTKFEVQGKLFNLPAGAVRMAAGAEYMWVKQNVEAVSPNNTSNTSAGARFFVSNLGPRKVKSGYLEFLFPLISEEMGVPLVQALDVNLSGRIDDYSDFGSTKNPKVAANWQVNDWIKLRGNFAKSFVAPPLNQVGDPSQGYLRGATGTSASTQIAVPFALYPEVRNVPGCQAVTGPTCTIGGTLNPGLDRSLGAGFAGVVPQTGDSWSVGVDLSPPFIPGLTANVTYWANTFNGGVASPAQPLIINSAALHNRLTICATGCTPEQVRVFTNVDNGATVGATLPPTVYFMINRDVGNVLNLHVQGIDAMFAYRIPTDVLGTFTLGGSLTYFTKFDQDFGDAPFSVLNTSGYNSQFPSIQTKARGQVGWQRGPVSVDVFANYTGKYHNWINTSILPVLSDARGNPIGGGDLVKADLTFDLHAAYEFEGDLLNGSQIYIDVKNVFDKTPPFYNGNTTGVGVGAWGFNGFTSNVLGRLMSVGFRAAF